MHKSYKNKNKIKTLTINLAYNFFSNNRMSHLIRYVKSINLNSLGAKKTQTTVLGFIERHTAVNVQTFHTQLPKFVNFMQIKSSF